MKYIYEIIKIDSKGGKTRLDVEFSSDKEAAAFVAKYKGAVDCLRIQKKKVYQSIEEMENDIPNKLRSIIEEKIEVLENSPFEWPQNIRMLKNEKSNLLELHLNRVGSKVFRKIMKEASKYIEQIKESATGVLLTIGMKEGLFYSVELNYLQYQALKMLYLNRLNEISSLKIQLQDLVQKAEKIEIVDKKENDIRGCYGKEK